MAVKVGNNPEPELKETSQKSFPFILVFRARGLCIAQASPNLFGPIPKIGSFASTPLVIDKVVPKRGLTSVLAICKRFGIIPLINFPDIKNNKDIVTTTKEIRGKFFFSISSSLSSFL